MSKSGHYLGGHTIIRVRPERSAKKAAKPATPAPLKSRAEIEADAKRMAEDAVASGKNVPKMLESANWSAIERKALKTACEAHLRKRFGAKRSAPVETANLTPAPKKTKTRKARLKERVRASLGPARKTN